MKWIIFVKSFTYWHPDKEYFSAFERMRRYNLPEHYADWFIENGYAIPYLTMADLDKEQKQ